MITPKYSNKSVTKPLKSKHSARFKLKKYFTVVTFIVFLRKESKKLALVRKNNLRKFWL
jgi:hypothetical protein